MVLTKKLLITSSLFLPVLYVHGFDPGWAVRFIGGFGSVIGGLIPIFIGIALLVFIWGVVQFIATDEESKRSEGKKRIAWGLVGLFVIISVWGLVLLIQTLLGIRAANVNPPQSIWSSAPRSSGSDVEPQRCSDGSGWPVGHPCCIDTYDEQDCQG